MDRPALQHRPRTTIGLALLAGIVGAAFTCQDPAGPERSDTIVVAFDADSSTWPRDSWTLLEGSVEGDSLRLFVQYGGGCREHVFWLVAVDGWMELEDQGSSPTVAVPLLLTHEANGDPCRALLGRELSFHLAPLAQAYRDQYGSGPAKIVLRLTDGEDDAAVHTFEWVRPGD